MNPQRNVLPLKIHKRDGSIVSFDQQKILIAIEKAAYAALKDQKKSQQASREIIDIALSMIKERFVSAMPSVEAVGDIVEIACIKSGYPDIAKSYILYREQRSELRLTKLSLGIQDDLKLTLNALEVLKRRYLLRDESQQVIETPGALFQRVAAAMAQPEKNYKSKFSVDEVEEQFYQIMRNLEFLPNSPTLMNAGTTLGQLSACFVLPVEDSIEDIFSALKLMARIHQTGGGTGFDFSHVRPKGDLVSTTKGEASGPVSFMSIFDLATAVIVQGGRRRGANMGILRCDHPDIFEFVEAKRERSRFTNFNLSVGVTDAFMQAVYKNEKFSLINPRTKKPVREIKARVLFENIVFSAWQTGDPGLVFLDEINRRNTVPELGEMTATNPCGELPLFPYESCNLGSINLLKVTKGNTVDWDKLRQTIDWGVRFLDNVIEMNRFPTPEIRKITFANRKIGLGVMGFADMLIKLGLPYNSATALEFAEKLMRFIHDESLKASAQLAKERGIFPNFERSVYKKENIRLRNATVNTIAPTGTISIIAGCSSGIEPIFAVSFMRKVLSGTRLFELNPLFEEMVKAKGIFRRELMAKIAHHGSIRDIEEIPKNMRNIFVAAFDIAPAQHVKIQAAFQKYTDNSVSKTINLSPEATVEDIRDVYLLAHRLKCKGITIYRYGSKEEQVLSFGADKGNASFAVDADFSGGCPGGICG